MKNLPMTNSSHFNLYISFLFVKITIYISLSSSKQQYSYYDLNLAFKHKRTHHLKLVRSFHSEITLSFPLIQSQHYLLLPEKSYSFFLLSPQAYLVFYVVHQ